MCDAPFQEEQPSGEQAHPWRQQWLWMHLKVAGRASLRMGLAE
jgi:hypothetical protein